MARMFLVKDGPPPAAGPPKNITLSELYNFKSDLKAKWLGTEFPTFNRESPSMYPQHVIIQVETSEVDHKQFKKEGYHLLLDISPEAPEFKRRFCFEPSNQSN